MDLLEEDNGHPPGYKQERFEQKCAELKEIADEHNIKGVRFFNDSRNQVQLSSIKPDFRKNFEVKENIFGRDFDKKVALTTDFQHRNSS